MGLKSNLWDLSSFSALTLLVGSFDPLKPVPDMTYNVFGGTLNLALSISSTNGSLLSCPRFVGCVHSVLYSIFTAIQSCRYFYRMKNIFGKLYEMLIL